MKPEPLYGKLGDEVTILSIEEVKSACEFYLRYKDKPELLFNDFPDYKEIANKEKGIKLELDGEYTYVTIEYNEWLFRLAFKDVLK